MVYSKPITNLTEAKSFIRSLSADGLMFHFDECALECLWRNGLVSKSRANQINKRVDECCALDWQDHECAIGYCLKVIEEGDTND